MLLDAKTYYACAAIWDLTHPAEIPEMEHRMQKSLAYRRTADELLAKTQEPQGHRRLMADLQNIPTLRPDDWVFNISSPQGQMDLQFLVPLNDDPDARMESYQLLFALTPVSLKIEIETGDPFNSEGIKHFQLQLDHSGDQVEYHIYFKDELLTYNLRQLVMKIMHVASRFTFNSPQRTALISTLQVLKFSS